MQSPQPRQNILWHEYLSINRSRSKEISFSQRLSYNVFLTTSFSQRASHNVFLTTSFHNVSLTPLSLHIRPHNVFLTTSQYTRNLSVLYKCPAISNSSKFFTMQFRHFVIDQTETSTLHIYNIYSSIVWRSRTRGQKLHTKVPRTKKLYKYLE